MGLHLNYLIFKQIWGELSDISYIPQLVQPDIGALAKKSNDNALSLVFKITNE